MINFHSSLSSFIFFYLMHSYNLVYFVLTYCIPLVIMLMAYIQMGSKLWGQQNIGEDTPTLAKCRKTKQKVGSFIYSQTSHQDISN